MRLLLSLVPGTTAFLETARSLQLPLREAILDHDAFDAILNPCELPRCRATCCHDGAVLSPEEASVIRDLLQAHPRAFPGPALAKPIEERQHSLKTATGSALPEELASDFPAHFARTRCVFLDREHKCTLQTLSAILGHDSWFFKPIACWMHPVSLRPGPTRNDRPTLTVLRPSEDEARFASCTPCGRPDSAGRPAKDVLLRELRTLSTLSGRDFVKELNAPPWLPQLAAVRTWGPPS